VVFEEHGSRTDARSLGEALPKLGVPTHAPRASPHLGPALHRSSPWTLRTIAEVHGRESLESTKICRQVSFQRARRIAELFGSPGELDNPMQIGEQIQLRHAGLNFQKHFAPTRMRANPA